MLELLKNHTPDHANAVNAHLAHWFDDDHHHHHRNDDDEQDTTGTDPLADETIVLNTSGSAENEISDENIIGDSGSDTLVGGDNDNDNDRGHGRGRDNDHGKGRDRDSGDNSDSGSDDIIGFSGLSNDAVEIDNAEALPFELNDIQTVGDLLPFITNISETDGNVTFEFGDGDASITLVGVSASEITADMAIFDL